MHRNENFIPTKAQTSNTKSIWSFVLPVYFYCFATVITEEASIVEMHTCKPCVFLKTRRGWQECQLTQWNDCTVYISASHQQLPSITSAIRDKHWIPGHAYILKPSCWETCKYTCPSWRLPWVLSTQFCSGSGME